VTVHIRYEECKSGNPDFHRAYSPARGINATFEGGYLRRCRERKGGNLHKILKTGAKDLRPGQSAVGMTISERFRHERGGLLNFGSLPPTSMLLKSPLLGTQIRGVGRTNEDGRYIAVLPKEKEKSEEGDS